MHKAIIILLLLSSILIVSLFLPTEKNNKIIRPNVLSAQTLESKTESANEATPTPSEKPKQSPTSSISKDSGDSSIQEYFIDEINKYRASIGVGGVSMNSETCDFARVRAEEISKSFTHDGFYDRVNNGTLPYPSRTQATENLAMFSDYKKVVPAWIASEKHSENMRKDTEYVCVINYGIYYAYEGWQP